jgi:hypothetical protein
MDLGALSVRQYPDPEGHLDGWARAIVRGPTTDTLSLLKDLSAAVPAGILYQDREEEGTQTPVETLARGTSRCLSRRRRAAWGSGRASSRGISEMPIGRRPIGRRRRDPRLGGGLCARAGRRTFGPTNRSVCGANLIPVAVVRDIRQAVPVAGSFVSPSDTLVGMSVTVTG